MTTGVPLPGNKRKLLMLLMCNNAEQWKKCPTGNQFHCFNVFILLCLSTWNCYCGHVTMCLHWWQGFTKLLSWLPVSELVKLGEHNLIKSTCRPVIQLSIHIPFKHFRRAIIKLVIMSAARIEPNTATRLYWKVILKSNIRLSNAN